ncbi:elongation factor P [Candidatus Aerophobetes bacterium]|uniref:Elongation factor P n=1 Tax=Aerophobetes bacterium TaxID=2030807 RepID=A0A2A4YPI9_UNCAE|nr:MAG: elongation factor P [Candidatus Aerophobetes bacterium]
MAKVSSNDVKNGMKIEIDNEPYTIVSADFVKPGKGQAFTRTKLRHLISGRVIDRTFKSTDKLELADVEEKKMRFLYKEQESIIFMDDRTYDQIEIPADAGEACRDWLLEDLLYDIIFYKGSAVAITPPTFMELTITATDPGARGDTASGRVLKPATLETGAKVQVPIFINEGEKIKVDTRTGEYVSRV